MTTPSDHSNKHSHDPKNVDAIGHDEGPARHAADEDSSVDLGHPVGGDPFNQGHMGSQSGISVVDWASLVEDVPALPADPATFDAPSDVDILFPGATFSAHTAEVPAPQLPQIPAQAALPAQEELDYAQPVEDVEATLFFPPEKLTPFVVEPAPATQPMISFSTEEPIFTQKTEQSHPRAEASAEEEEIAIGEDAVVFEEATAVSDSAIHDFLSDVSEPSPPAAEEAAVAFENEPDLATDSAVHAFLAAAPEVPTAAPVETPSGVLDDAVEFVPEEEVAVTDSAVHALLADEPEVPTAAPVEAPSGVLADAVEFVPEEEVTAADSAVHAFLFDAPEVPTAAPVEAPSGVSGDAVEYVPEGEATAADSAVHAFLFDAPEVPTAAPVEAPSGVSGDAVEYVPEGEATAADSAVHAFLFDAPEVPTAAPVEAPSGVSGDAVEYVPEGEVTAADSAAHAFLFDAPEVPTAAPVEAPSGVLADANEFVPEHEATTSDSAVHAFLTDAPEVPSGVLADAIEFVPEHEATTSDSAVHAFLTDAPQVPTAAPVEAPSGVSADAVEFVPEEEVTATDSAVHALLAEAPELKSAPSGPITAEVHFVPKEEVTADASAVDAFLAEEPEMPSAPPSGPIAAEVEIVAEEEAALPEAPPLASMSADTPPPLSEMALAEAAAFASPEEMLEEKEFTPETMFAEPEVQFPSSHKKQLAPKMELDSGRHLEQVVELGEDSVVSEPSRADLEPFIAEVEDEDDVIVAEEEGPGAGAVMAEIAEYEEIAEVAEVSEGEVMDFLGEEAHADSALGLSEVVPEVVESDYDVPPPVPESEILVAEHESSLNLTGVEDAKPLSSGDVAMEPAIVETTGSGRDLIAEAVESGIDGTLELPAMEVVDSEITVGPASGVKRPKSRDKEPTREIEIPASLHEPDDFFAAVDSAVVSGNEDNLVLGEDGEVIPVVAAESSSIDLGSMPEMLIVPSAPQAGSEVPDIDLTALEQDVSPSQRGAGKANAEGEIDLGQPSELSGVGSISAAAMASPVVVDEADIDFAALEDAALPGGSAARSGKVAFGEDLETEPTAEFESAASGVALDEDAGVAQGLLADGEETATLAQDDESEGAVVEPEEEEKPKGKGKGRKAEKEVKAKGRGGAWVGGTMVGTLVGAGACVGLWLSGMEPPKDWRKMLGTDKGGVTKVDPVSGTSSTPQDLVARGNYTEAKQALAAAPDNSEKQFLLGQIEFREHAVATARAAGNDDPKLTTEDKPIKSAIEKFEAVKTPDAYFQLGQIYELSGDADKAKESYKAGLDKSTDEAGKKRFQNALDKLELSKLTALPQRGGPLDAQLALLAVLLFAPDDAGAAPAPDEEAGYAFWRAVKALKEKKFDVALAEMESARKKHLKGRLLRIGRQQNPESDPTEEIFLRCVNELKVFWAFEQKYNAPADGLEKSIAETGSKALADKLVKAKVIAKPEDLETGLDALLKMREDLATKLDVKDPEKIDAAVATFLKKDGDLDQLNKERAALLDVAKKVGSEKEDAVKIGPDKVDDVKTRVADLAADGALVKKIGDKLKTDTVIEKFEKRDDVEAGINTLVKDWKTIPDLTEKLKTARTFVDDLYDALAKAGFLNKDMVMPAPAIVLKAAKNIVDMTQGDAAKKRIVRENADLSVKTGEQAKQLVDLDKQRLAELADQDKKNKAEVAILKTAQETAVAALKVENDKKVAGLTLKLTKSRTPEQMLSLWLPLLENRENKEFVKEAQLDATAVIMAADKKDDMAKAKVLQGLALRNLGQYPAAIAILNEAAQDLPRDEVWTLAVEEGLLESKDAVAFFTKRAADLAEHNYPDKAIQLFDRMLTAAGPEQKGRLLAERSLLRLEMAMAGGRAVEITDDLVKQALNDATAAGDLAVAHYALGRIREELGDLEAAKAEYTKAVNKKNEVNALEGSRYEAALARTLGAAPRGPRRAAVDPKPANVQVAQRDRDNDEDAAVALAPEEEQRLTLVLLTVMFQPPGPDAGAEQQAEQLADKILADPLSPWDARAQALMIKGRYTDALRTYAEGLQKNKQMRAQQAATLLKIINQHPRLKQNANAISNPLEAENQFGIGLRTYYSGQYAEAEKHFLAAVDAVDGDDEDARYFYFLGLTQMAQGRSKDAAQNIADGTALERRGKPSRVAVNASLERVQGELRRVLDDERKRVPTP